MILRVGLTGGIASGKSTVAAALGRLGCVTFDADRLVAELYEPGRAGHTALVAAYGDGILDAGGRIDRARLAEIAFSSPAEAARLNRLIHPIVMEEIDRRLDALESRQEDAIAVVEATLLLEAGGMARYDRIVVVDAATETQIERGISRGMSRDEVLRRIAHQMPRDERLARADYVLDNGGSRDEAAGRVRELYDRLRDDLAAKKRR